MSRILAACPSDSTTSSSTLDDLPALARFWTKALGWKVLSERENEIVIGTDESAPVGICFMPVTDPKTFKNRVHLDLTTSAADRDREIDRLLALGARRADIGQTGAESWTVLADPEGNESPRRAPEGNAHPMRLGTEDRRQTLSAAIEDVRGRPVVALRRSARGRNRLGQRCYRFASSRSREGGLP